jgi:outer membrane receptor protein involved in Fe transport
VSGYGALRWRLGDGWEASLQLARGFRDARLSDRYFKGVTGRGEVTGNPDLDPETSRQLDLALRGKAGPLQIAAYGYLYRIRDLIERYRIDEDSFGFRNRNEEEIHGFELEADWLMRPKLSLRTTIGLARGEIREDGSDPDDIPADTLTLSLHHRPTERIWWRLDATAVDADERPGPTERETHGYGVFDAAAGYRFDHGLELRLLLGNLTDKSYLSSSDEKAPLAPGRSAAIVLAGRF